jgi:phosphate transport system ATP-binding protein
MRQTVAAKLHPISNTRLRMGAEGRPPKMKAKGVDVWYGDVHAVRSVDLDIFADDVTALIGPSGCGKSTILRCFNRMNDTIPGCRVTGDILLENDPWPANVAAAAPGRHSLRNRTLSSRLRNVAYGPRIHGLARNGAELDEIVGESLQRAGLWEEIKDRLDEPGTALSGGQQQRLCIARAIGESGDR